MLPIAHGYGTSPAVGQMDETGLAVVNELARGPAVAVNVTVWRVTNRTSSLPDV